MDGQGRFFHGEERGASLPDHHDNLVPGRVMSRLCAGPGGGRANCGDVGGFARADILIEHYEHNVFKRRGDDKVNMTHSRLYDYMLFGNKSTCDDRYMILYALPNIWNTIE